MRWSRRGSSRATAGALVVVAFAVLSAFPSALSPARVFFQRDVLAYWYATVATFVRVVGGGELPLWDAYEGYGLPLWADPASQVAYPTTWLNLLLLPHVVYKVVVLGHALWAALGVFVLLRRAGLARVSASVGAIAFACSGPIVSAGTLTHHLCGAAWIPWALWAFEGVLRSGGRREVGAMALVLGAQALAGSAEACAMTGMAALLRWLMLLARERRAAVRAVPPVAAAAGIAALIAALQWLPTLSILDATNRRTFTSEQNLYWSIHPATLVDTMVPRLASEMAMGEDVRNRLYEGREPFLESLYLGIAALPLVLLALRSRHPSRTWLVVGLAVFAGLALGRFLPPARVLLALPPLSLFRYPAKYAWPAAFFWSALAALGTEVWRRPFAAGDRRYARAVGGALLLGTILLAASAVRRDLAAQPLTNAFAVQEPFREWMTVLAARKLGWAALWLGCTAVALLLRTARPRWRYASAAFAGLVVAADVTAGARPVNRLAPLALVQHRPPVLDLLLPRAGEARLLVASGALDRLNRSLVRGPAGWDREWSFVLGAQERIAPPSGSRWGLRGSYDADFTGLGAMGLQRMSGLVRQLEGSPLSLRLLQLGNVGWVIDDRADAFPLLSQAATFDSVYAQPLRVLAVPDPLPGAYVVGSASRAGTDDDAIARLLSPDFDPRREVVLAGTGSARLLARGWSGGVRVLTRGQNALRVETETNAPGILVVVEGYHRDWRATVDGVPARVERANVAFRGVEVAAGRHTIDLRYAPRSIPWAIGLGAAGLLLALALRLTRARSL
jgi:Bacterial membrane protein YfhO